MSKSILLISRNPQDIAFAKGVAETASIGLITVPSLQEAMGAIAENPGAFIFLDASSGEHYRLFEQAIQEKFGLFSEKADANLIHCITERSLENCPELIQGQLCGHYIQRNFQDAESDGRYYGRVIRASLTGRAFGMQTLFGTDVKTQTVKLQRSTQKQDAVEAVKNYLIAAKFQTRMATVIANAVDEILMNAIYDAPVDHLGKPLYPAVPRSTLLELEGKGSVEMHIAFDQDVVAISAIDLYGSLEKSRLLQHLAKAYSDKAYQVKTAVAGAGIGLATVFRLGGSFLFAAEKSSRTEVTVFFRKASNYREFKDQFHFISTQFYF